LRGELGRHDDPLDQRPLQVHTAPRGAAGGASALRDPLLSRPTPGHGHRVPAHVSGAGPSRPIPAHHLRRLPALVVRRELRRRPPERLTSSPSRAGMLSRRRFLGALSAGLTAPPLAAQAQPTGKVARVGFLYFGSRHAGVGANRYAAFLEGLRELGYVEGKSVIVEARFAESRPERLADLVAELLRLKVDVIVATGGPAYRVLQRTTAAPPVAVTVTNDPVLDGLAASLARPAGNFTGLTDTAGDLTLKQLELLKVVSPKLSRVSVLTNRTNASHARQATQLTLTSQKLGIQVTLGEASTAAQIEPTMASFALERADVVVL